MPFLSWRDPASILRGQSSVEVAPNTELRRDWEGLWLTVHGNRVLQFMPNGVRVCDSHLGKYANTALTRNRVNAVLGHYGYRLAIDRGQRFYINIETRERVKAEPNKRF